MKCQHCNETEIDGFIEITNHQIDYASERLKVDCLLFAGCRKCKKFDILNSIEFVESLFSTTIC